MAAAVAFQLFPTLDQQYQSHIFLFFFFFFSEIAHVAFQEELLSPTFPEASNASPLVFSFNTNASSLILLFQRRKLGGLKTLLGRAGR